MSDMSDTTPNEDPKSLADEVKQLRADLARMAEIVEGFVRRGADQAAEEVGRRAEAAWDDAGKLAEDATKMVEANPLGAVGGALGVGILIGLLFGRR